MEGRSLTPLFRGREFKREKPIFYEHEGNRAERPGRWKLVSVKNRPWELYDMERDRTETQNWRSVIPNR